MPNIRYDRINEEVKKTISEIVREMKDPRISPMTTISSAEVTNDQKIAKVKVSVYDEDDAVRNGTVDEMCIRDRLIKHGGPNAAAMAESALNNAKMLERFGFDDIVISVKSSSVTETVKAYRLLSESCAYPLHVGVTEVGGGMEGIVRSAAGIGTLLMEGIGDTIRAVSYTHLCCSMAR